MALVAITRAEPGAGATAARVTRLGHRPLIAPLVTIKPLHPPLPDAMTRAQALVFTSAQTPALVTDRQALLEIPVFAVGDSTAAAARSAGFTTVHSADADGAALLALLKAKTHPDAGAVWHLGGQTLATDLATALTEAGYIAQHLVLYQAEPVTTLPAALVAALTGPETVFVLLYSQAAADVLARLAPAGGWHGLCLSQRVAEPLFGLGPRLSVASEPREEALLALLPRPTGEHA